MLALWNRGQQVLDPIIGRFTQQTGGAQRRRKFLEAENEIDFVTGQVLFAKRSVATRGYCPKV